MTSHVKGAASKPASAARAATPVASGLTAGADLGAAHKRGVRVSTASLEMPVPVLPCPACGCKNAGFDWTGQTFAPGVCADCSFLLATVSRAL